ncbi:MAG: hypothetical protein ABIF19_08860 [Planctomycetota bacterium]
MRTQYSIPILFLSCLCGCSIPVSEMKLTSSILTTGGEKTVFKRIPQTGPFKMEDTIHLLTTLRWRDVESGAGVHKVVHKWYAGEDLVSRIRFEACLYRTPYEIRSQITASSLGVGSHKVELYIDNILFDQRYFEVVE